MLLQVERLDVYYGAVHALKGVTLCAEAGEIVTLIGANGAGKTTLLRSISGVIPSRSGRVTFEGRDITRLPAHDIVGLGISQAPEGRMVFANLSVEDNLELGAYRRKDRPGISKDREEVFHLFPRLRERRRQSAGTLSGGEQQMLAIGRALMSKPKLLLVDELSLGLAPIIVQGLTEALQTLCREDGLGVIVVDEVHQHDTVSSSRRLVLEKGRFVNDVNVAAEQEPFAAAH